MILSSDSIDLVIFDCDGVLVDSEVISARVIVEMLANEGVDIEPDYVYKHFLGRQFSSVGETVLKNFSIDLPSSFESDYREKLVLAFKQELRTTTGIKDVLSNLCVRSCVATSSSRLRAQESLKLVGLINYFGDNIFTSSEVKFGKPAPDLFLLASKRMQVEPDKCLVIEDSVTGISAATAAGMNVWRYTGASHFGFGVGGVADQFSKVSIFDEWGKFFEMVPALKRQI